MGEFADKKLRRLIWEDEIRKFLAENRKKIIGRLIKRLKKEGLLKKPG